MIRVLFVLGLFLSAAVPSADMQAQTTSLPPVRALWVKVGADSLRLEYSTPSVTGTWPTVLVLPDRFGINDGVRGILKILARMGFLAYAVPMRSATATGHEGIPPVDFDSTDVDVIIEVTADISERGGSSGSISLLGFDTGASAAIRAASRMPFYKSCVLFYPALGRADLEHMLQVQCPMQLNIPQLGLGVTLQDISQLRDTFIDAGKQVRVRYYKEAKPFFFNPVHADYHRKDTQIAWNELLEYLRTHS